MWLTLQYDIIITLKVFFSRLRILYQLPLFASHRDSLEQTYFHFMLFRKKKRSSIKIPLTNSYRMFFILEL